MPERQLPHPQEVFDLILTTRANAQGMHVARHNAEAQADESAHRLLGLLGGMATDHYMRHRLPTEETIGQVGQAAALAGWHWLRTQALSNGAERQLPTFLKETNDRIVAMLSGAIVTATITGRVRPSLAFGLRTSPGGTRYDNMPDMVSGPLVEVDALRARLFLGHPTNPEHAYEVGLLNGRDRPQIDLSFSLPETPAG